MNRLSEKHGGSWLPILILTALLALPSYWFFHLEVFPFTDLPNHLAAATIYQHLDDPQTRFAAYFSSGVSLLKPNIAHILFCSAFSSVETGNRAWLYLMLMILAVSMTLLFRLTKANASLLPLAALLVFNSSLSWGFMGFAFAVPLLFGLAVSVLLFLRVRSFPRGIVVSSILLLLFYTHVLALLFGLLFLLLAALTAGKGSTGRRLVIGGAPALPALLVVGAWLVWGREFHEDPTSDFLLGYYRWHYVGSLLARAGRLLTNDNVVLAPDQAAIPWTGVFSMALLAGLFSLFRKGQVAAFWERTESRVIFAFFVAACMCYAGLPNFLPGVVPVYGRFSVLVTSGALMITAAASTHLQNTKTMVLATLVAAAYMLFWHGYFSDFERSSRDFSRDFLAHAGERSTVLAAVIRDPEFRGSRPLVHYNNYHIIWNLGITPTKLAEYRFGAIRPKPGGKLLPEYQEWVSPEARTDELLRRYAGAGYILFHSLKGPMEKGEGSDLVESARSGQWVLYERRGHP